MARQEKLRNQILATVYNIKELVDCFQEVLTPFDTLIKCNSVNNAVYERPLGQLLEETVEEFSKNFEVMAVNAVPVFLTLKG